MVIGQSLKKAYSNVSIKDKIIASNSNRYLECIKDDICGVNESIKDNIIIDNNQLILPLNNLDDAKQYLKKFYKSQRVKIYVKENKVIIKA